MQFMSSQFLQDCQRFGWWSVLPRELFRRLRWLIGLRCYGIYLREFSYREVCRDISDFSLKIFEPGQQAELLTLVKRPELNLTPEFVHAAMQRGDICSVIIHDNEIVSFDWSAFVAPTPVEQSVFLEFGDGCRYAYFAYTLP
jgi:hypothetical protein